MTPEDIAAIVQAATDCDPEADLDWDRVKSCLTITCREECAEPVRAAVEPYRTPHLILVIRRRIPQGVE